MIKNNNYKAVLVYTGYNENSVEGVENIESSSLQGVMNFLYQRDKERNEEYYDGSFDEFFGRGIVVNEVGVSECGEENCWVVLPEGHKFYDLVSIDCGEWSNEQWDQWMEFMDKEVYE